MKKIFSLPEIYIYSVDEMEEEIKQSFIEDYEIAKFYQFGKVIVVVVKNNIYEAKEKEA